MRILYVPLDKATLARLVALARQERRRPQDQAAYLLERALLSRVVRKGPADSELAEQPEREVARC